MLIPSIEPKTPENIKFDINQSFDITTNNIQFKLNISYNVKTILFDIEIIGQFPKEDYTRYFNMNQLGEINKFFVQFENFGELLESLKMIIN